MKCFMWKIQLEGKLKPGNVALGSKSKWRSHAGVTDS